jgi:Domain of unknown function (DUF4118)
MRDESVGLGVGLGVLGAIIIAGLLVPIRDWLGASNVALVLAIVVVVAAIVGGRIAGAATSVAAALAFDFFYTRPYYTLRIDKREDVIAAVLLLVLGVIVGELGVLRAGSRREANLNALAAKRLELVAAVVATGAPLDEVWPVVRQAMLEQLDLVECRFEVIPFDVPLVEIDRSGHLDSTALRYEDGGFVLPPEGAAIRVTHGRRLLGRLVLVPGGPHGTTRAERRVGVALADQLAVAAARNTTLHPLT